MGFGKAVGAIFCRFANSVKIKQTGPTMDHLPQKKGAASPADLIIDKVLLNNFVGLSCTGVPNLGGFIYSTTLHGGCRSENDARTANTIDTVFIPRQTADRHFVG